MTDERRRELERSDDVEDRARLLVERVRAGDLAADRLRLAAYLGHAGARLAVEGESWEPPTGGLRAWVSGLVRYGKEARVRAALAICEAVVVEPRGEVEPTRPWRRVGEPDFARAAVDAVRAWLACPCDEHRGQCRQAADAAGLVYPGALRLDERWAAFAQAAAAAAYLTAEPDAEVAQERWHVAAGVEVDAARRLLDDAPLFVAVTSALVPWALSDRAGDRSDRPASA